LGWIAEIISVFGERGPFVCAVCVRELYMMSCMSMVTYCVFSGVMSIGGCSFSKEDGTVMCVTHPCMSTDMTLRGIFDIFWM
jgi:hypothetical protein